MKQLTEVADKLLTPYSIKTGVFEIFFFDAIRYADHFKILQEMKEKKQDADMVNWLVTAEWDHGEVKGQK